MKKKIIITVLSVIISLGVIFSILTISHADKIRNLETGSQECEEYFADISAAQLIKDMNFFLSYDTLNPNLVFALYDKLGIDDAEYCDNIIKSPFYSNTAKIAILDISESKEIKLDKDVLSKMIGKKSLNCDLRSYIICYCGYQDKDYLEEISKVASDSSDELSYYALFQLKFVEKDEARKIAKQVISEYNGEYSDRLGNTMIIESERVKESGDEEEMSEFNKFYSKVAEEKKAKSIN